ncbi:MAG: hypothetical protein IJ049_06630 [Oscillospiraceae bacterium]|nr:hypothetical protein [Oscillospiraceae bacterium]
MANEAIRNEVKSAGVRYWQIADRIGISAVTLSVWLRHELSPERAVAVRGAIRQLMGEAAEGGKTQCGA